MSASKDFISLEELKKQIDTMEDDTDDEECVDFNRVCYIQHEDVCISPYSYLPDMIAEGDERVPEYLQEIRERGFDTTELWNLDETIAAFLLPRLRAFMETTVATDDDQQDFHQVIYRAIYQLEKHMAVRGNTKFFNESDYEEFEEALGNLGKIMLRLWT